MTDPLLSLPPGGRLPAAGATGQSGATSALVLAPTRQGPLIESAGRRWQVSDAPPLPQGAKLSLAAPVTGTRSQTARLLAIGARVLAEPATIRLRPAAPRESAPGPRASLPRILQVEARLIGPAGRAVGPRLTIGLSLAAGPAGAAEMLLAEVVRRDAQGRLLLSAAGASLRLEARLDLPPGARLSLALPQAAADDAAAADPRRRTIALLLERDAAGGSVERSPYLRLPAPDHALAARLLRWVEALTAGAVPAAEPTAVRGALGELARQAREPQAGGWRVLMMPIGGDEPGALKLCLRQTTPDADEEPAEQAAPRQRKASQRAIFAFELSHLGPCQLDVLCQEARFDLVVRTSRPLGATVEAEIGSLIDASRAAAGLSGRLEFRAGDLLVLPDPPPPAGRHLTV